MRGNLQRRREAVVCSAGLIVQTIYGTIHEQTFTLLCHIIPLEVQWVQSSLVVYSYSSLQRADQQTKNDASNLKLHCFEKCKKIGPISLWIINYPWLHPISRLHYCAKNQLSSSQCYQDTWMASNLWNWFQRMKPDFLIAGYNVHVLRLCRGRSPGDITHPVLPLDGASVGHFHLQTWREVHMNGQLYTLINAHHSRLNWTVAAANHPFTACL